MTTEFRHCIGVRKDGSPCQAPAGAILADGYCFAHSPTRQAERQAARSQGGKNKSNLARAIKALPKDLRDVRDVLLEALRDVRNETLSPARATAMATIARVLCDLQAAGEVDARLAALEEHEAGKEVRA